MCDTCEKAKKLPVSEALGLVALAMKKRRGRTSKCLDATLDSLLGTAESAEDRKARQRAERAFERSRQ